MPDSIGKAVAFDLMSYTDFFSFLLFNPNLHNMYFDHKTHLSSVLFV